MSEVINHAERSHSSVGASSASRWINCPASVVVSEGLPNPSSVYALEGTAAHELCELCFLSDQEAHDLIGTEIGGFEVNEEMADAVKIYVDYLRQKESEGYMVYIEERFHVTSISEEMFGTCDAVLHSPFDTLIICDFKYGKGVPVPSKENKQLSYYGVGVCDSREGLSDVDKVELVVVQPRLGDGEPIKVWETDTEYLDGYRRELSRAYNKVIEAKAKGVDHPKLFEGSKSGDHCKWCLAKPTCPKLREDNFEVCKAAFSETSNIVRLPDPSDLSDVDLAKVVDRANIISDWVGAVKSHVLTRLEAGNKVEGFKLVKKRSNRKWTDEQEVVKIFSSLVDEKDMYSKPKLKSPAQLEKIVGKSNIEKYTHKPEAGNTLARDYDDREEQKPEYIGAFASV